jgi:uncharacterized Rossmann fold enzyme
MDFEAWEGYYNQILSDFGFKKEEDERSASVLSELLLNKTLASEDEIRGIIQGKDVFVIGGGKNLEIELSQDLLPGVIIAADGTTSQLLKRNIIPHVIVTDLDGNVEDQLKANENGALIAVHAHGDNIEAIRKWTPKFQGKIIGSVQCKPFSNLHNFGGFTDGDRGVFLAHHFGAKDIRLIGFDFENVGEKPNSDREIKARKLRWAKKLIFALGVKVN